MANELQALTTTGLTLYAVLINATGQIWNGSTFVTYNGTNWADYDIALTEAGAGIYMANMPAAAAGSYSYAVYEQAGSSPATTDTLRGTGFLEWDGSAVLPLSTIESQTDDIGTAGAGLTGIPWNAAWDAEVQSEATDALNAYDPPTNAELEARTLVAANYFDPAADTVDVGKISGDSVAADNLEAATDGGVYNVGGGGIVASNVSLGLTADESASLKIWLATLGYLNYEAEHALLPATINALNDITPAQVNAEVVDALTVDVIADSVATDGTRPTIAQALLEITRFLMERSVTSTTMTVTKEDGTTSSMTFTLDSATAPTAITRAS